MSQLMTLSVRERTEKGKGKNRRLRGAGQVPGVYYHPDGTNLTVQVDELILSKMLGRLGLGRSKVFELEIEQPSGKQTKPSLLWDVLYDPVKSRALHVDFLGVDLDKNIRVSVRFEVAGKAKGVANGGVLEVYRDSVDVVCKPLDIPEHILVDVTELEIGDNVHVADVSFPAGVQAMFDENFAVLGVVVPSAVKDEAEAAAAAEAAAEGEPVVEGEEAAPQPETEA